jgi:hypothetical protein
MAPLIFLERGSYLLGRSVKARTNQQAITLQEREKVSVGSCLNGMALHHPVYQVNQAIGSVGQGGLAAFE